MKLSTKTRYALRALVDLATNYNGTPVKINAIASRQDLSNRYLENLFTILKSANLLKSRKGKAGGFVLSKDPEDITVLEVFEIIEGKLAIIECLDNSQNCDDKKESCPTFPLWSKLNNTIKETLQNITLAKLVDDYKNKTTNSGIYYI